MIFNRKRVRYIRVSFILFDEDTLHCYSETS